MERDVAEPAVTEAEPRQGRSLRTTDGRRRRSERSRAAIVEAFLELLREGARPSSSEIAARAGCTQRTLFNHFADMEALREAVAIRQTERVLSLLPEPTEGTLDERADRYADALSRLLEDSMHVRWAVLVAERGEIAGFDVLQATHELFRDNLRRCFATELGALDEPAQAALLDALDVVTDAAVWRIRRVAHGQSVDAARCALRRTLTTLLGSG